MEFSLDNVVFDSEAVRRFDVDAPRYTSYPTADRFIDGFVPARDELGPRRRESGSALSLYIHLPFCSAICYYCACNKIVTNDHRRSTKYLRYLAKEMALRRACPEKGEGCEGRHAVEQLHLGGGTPTFLSDDELGRLMETVRGHFDLVEGGEYSIEAAPRGLKRVTLKRLVELGFNRLSVGVQDFDEAVQRAIHRVQPEKETRDVIETARAAGFRSIGVDLMYGLPKQSVDSFERTLDHVIAISPDRLSVYNYAHLPALFKPQRRIDSADLPAPEERLRILSLTIRKLIGAGYVFIGMDHFARPDDELAVAQRERRLHRNFQGYSTRPDCDMLAFGVSSISRAGSAYYQNAKTLGEYYARLDQGELPVSRGIRLNADDLLRRAAIQSLMCHFELSFDAFGAAYGIDFADYFSAELAELGAMQKAGLLSIERDRVSISPMGRMLVRVISAVFDRHLRNDRERRRYSKVI
ncbi:MAG: oxygen-independent coproporphyrinogen III oxidase [Candidatus Accumulibacter sp.]|jgi:oxygen-independent coproporphyrinogen-3 oxidase|nr:oxygen-independent coproporphyrinogen III oxidase [Accumulibacter sp.]